MTDKKDKVPLSELCEAIVDCEHKTASTQPWGIPSIRTTNIKNGRLDLENANRVSEETYKKWTVRLEPKPGDLILAREAPVGEVGIIPPGQRVCLGQRTVLIRTNKHKLHSRYLLYLLLTPRMRHEMVSHSEGSTVSHINMSDIRNLKIPHLPPLPEQKAIAHILGTLDDKIELNREMNQTLEAIARAIFKSWFVDFDPVRAKMEGRQPAGMDAATAKLFPDEFEDEDCLLGNVPKTWKVSILGELSMIVDSLHQTPSYVEQGYPMVRVTDIKGGYLDLLDCKRVTEEVFKEFTRKYVPKKGDIIFSRVGTYGVSSYVGSDENFCLGQNTIVINPKKNSIYLYLYLTDNLCTYQIEMSVVGSTQKTISLKNIKALKMLLPSQLILDSFNKIVEPLFFQINSNIEQSRTLASIRDTLLPKLLSGEIRVKEAEKLLETV